MEATGKAIAIVGLNASGKTRLVEQMRRQLASDRVRYMAFCDTYGAATDRAYYLQLRWNQHDIDEETPTVGARLEKAFLLTGPDTPERRDFQQQLYHLFNIHAQAHEYVILLSSGELRKFQLVRTLLAHPQILILDNPFIGLDAPTRQQLRDLLLQLAREYHIDLYLVLAKTDDLPDYVDETIRLGDEKPVAPLVIDMHHVSIRYGERTILSELDWQVRQGEHWALSGQNGSGKSTLLSLVCADNPQSYACDITLFGHPRGSGESIWDIKRRIGYVSPEMHRSYLRPLPALQVVASGLKDSVGLYVHPTEAERERCLLWMGLFGIAHLADRSFLQLSSGEQRLALVARAFVKDPDLLILDEPLHGLDDHNRQLVRSIIDAYCLRPEKTLIMVTHYDEELPSCIDHRLYLERQ